MASRCLSLMWAVSTVAVVYGQTTRPLQVEQLLFNKIFANYDFRARPVLDSRQAVNVSIGLDLTMIANINERSQIVTSHIWLNQEWHDPRLVWNPVQFGNFTKLRIPCKLIWLPDIVLYNSVEDQSRQYHEALANVDPDGTVLWDPIVRFKSSCEMDITFFPFDDQICSLKLGSWVYDGSQIDVFKLRNYIELKNNVESGEWVVKDTRVVKNVVYYPCCKEPYPDITFYLHIRRGSFYYVFNIIVPCIFLSVLTIFSFILPPGSDEKVTVGLTILVAYSMFMLLIANSMPPTSKYTPLISIYLIISMGLTSCTVVFTVLVLNLHYRGITNRRPPPLLYRVIVHHLGRMVFVSQKSAEMFSQGLGSVSSSRRARMLRIKMLAEASAASNLLPANVAFDWMGENTSAEDGTNRTSSIIYITGNRNNMSANPAQSNMLSYLQRMISKQSRIEDEAACIREWQLMAFVLDRLLLVLFVFILVLKTGYLLLLRPMDKSISMKAVDYV